MDRVDKAVYLLTPEPVHRREAQLEELTGPGAAARAIAHAFGRPLRHNAAVRWGRALHVAFGTGAGIAYPALARRLPALRGGWGACYGAALFPANDQVVPALGLTPPSRRFPAATRVRGFIYHLGYGVALETFARCLRLHEDRP